LKENILNKMETFAKTMVQPLRYITVIGITMVFGVLITNNTIVGLLPFLDWGPIQLLGELIYESMMILINNLGILFSIGIAAALVKKEKHQAAIIAFFSYLIYLVSNNTTLEFYNMLAEPQELIGLVGTGQSEVLGIQVLDTGVFSGILLGFLVGAVFNKTSNKRFKKSWLQVWGGANYSLFWMIIISVAMGFIAAFVWPPVQSVINGATNIISNTGNVGLFLYGFLERILVPTGLHHLIYTPFQFSDLGGSVQIDGQTISGAYAVFMSEVGNPSITQFSDSVRWMTIAFTKTFGYIGIAAAFVKTAKPENKEKIRAMLIPLVITSFMVSITEPIDFLFVFSAPLLFLLHAIISGSFMVLLNVFNIRAGTNGLSSIILNLALGAEKTQWPLLLLLAVVQIILYYFLFSYLIEKFDLKTPGREEELVAEPELMKTETKDLVNEQMQVTSENIESLNIDETEIQKLISGLGGNENILEVENCFTRLRVLVNDKDKVDEELIHTVDNSGIVKNGNNIQIVFGLEVTDIANDMKEALNL